MKRAAIYARVSTDDQRDNYSIPTQVAECFQYAEARGYAVVGAQFVDAQTGQDTVDPGNGAVKAYVDDYTSLELSRPSLDAVLRYLDTVGFDVLIVHAIDRLARDSYKRQTIEMGLESRGAKVEYVLGNYDDTAEGEVRKDLDATFAKWENAKRVERCNRGKKRKAETGLFVCGRAPYGYRIDADALGGLAVVEKQAEVVRRIFQLYAERYLSIRGIAATLTQEKVSPYLGGDGWAKSSVAKVLGNPVYVGHGFYNKHKRNGRSLEARPRDEWIEYQTTPLVEPWLFEETQRRLKENKKIRRRQPSRFYLLSGMVVCDGCGRAYVAQTALAGSNGRKNEARSYRHRQSEGHCSNHQMSARLLEPLVWGEIAKVLLDPQRLRRGYEDSIAQREETATRQKAHLETLSRKSQSLEQRRRNLTTAYVDPDIGMTKAEYLEQKVLADDDLAKLNGEIERIQGQLENIPTPASLEVLEAFASSITGLVAGEDNLTPEAKRHVLELLHIKVSVKSDRTMRIDGWFGAGIDGLSYTASSNCGRPPPPLPAPA